MSSREKGEENSDLTLKIVICGSRGTGKSSLVHILSKETEVPKKIAKASVGLETFLYECPQIRKQKIKIALWDIALGEKELLGTYVQRAFAVILMFDWSNAKSFAEMKDAFRFLRNASKSSLFFACPVAVVHIKTCITSEVSTEEFNAFNREATEYIPYVGSYNLSLMDKFVKDKACGMLNRLLSDYAKRKNEYFKCYPKTASVALKKSWELPFTIVTFFSILFLAFAYFGTLYSDDFWYRAIYMNCFLIVIVFWSSSFKMIYD